MPKRSTNCWKTFGTERKTLKNLPTPLRPGRTHSFAQAPRASTNQENYNEFSKAVSFFKAEAAATIKRSEECWNPTQDGCFALRGGLRTCWGLRCGASVQVLSARIV